MFLTHVVTLRIRLDLAVGVIAATSVVIGCGPARHNDEVPGVDGGTEVALDGTPEIAFDSVSDVKRAGEPCVAQSECDDGELCNGTEECLGGYCVSSRNIACKDPGGCATTRCVEGLGCVVDPNISRRPCVLPLVCRASVGCVDPETCDHDGDIRCDDNRACTRDRCDLSLNRCIHDLDDTACPPLAGGCGVPVCLGAHVAQASGCGVLPDASLCPRDSGCVADFAGAEALEFQCRPLPPTCVRDSDCSNHSFCDGVERCIAGRCEHGPQTRCIRANRCHEVRCIPRAVGDPYCLDEVIVDCSAT